MSDVESGSESRSYDDGSYYDDQSPASSPRRRERYSDDDDNDDEGSYYSDEGGSKSSYYSDERGEEESYTGSYTEGSASQTHGSGEVSEQQEQPFVFPDDEKPFVTDEDSYGESADKSQSGGSYNSQASASFYSEDDDRPTRNRSSVADDGSDDGSVDSQGSRYSDEQTRDKFAAADGASVDSQGSYYSDERSNDFDARSADLRDSYYSEEGSETDARSQGSYYSQEDDRSRDAFDGQTVDSHDEPRSVDSRGSYYSNDQRNEMADESQGSRGSNYFDQQPAEDAFDGGSVGSKGSYYSDDHDRSQGSRGSYDSDQRHAEDVVYGGSVGSKGSYYSDDHRNSLDDRSQGSRGFSQGSYYSDDQQLPANDEHPDGASQGSHHSAAPANNNYCGDAQTRDFGNGSDASFQESDNDNRSAGSEGYSRSGSSRHYDDERPNSTGDASHSGRTYDDDDRTFDIAAESQSFFEADLAGEHSKSYGSDEYGSEYSGSDQERSFSNAGDDQSYGSGQESNRIEQVGSPTAMDYANERVGQDSAPNGDISGHGQRTLGNEVESSPIASVHMSLNIRDRVAAIERQQPIHPVSPERHPTLMKDRFGKTISQIKMAQRVVTPDNPVVPPGKSNDLGNSRPRPLMLGTEEPTVGEEQSISFEEALQIPVVDLLSGDGSVSIAQEESGSGFSQSKGSQSLLQAEDNGGDFSRQDAKADKSYIGHSENDGSYSNSQLKNSFMSRKSSQGTDRDSVSRSEEEEGSYSDRSFFEKPVAQMEDDPLFENPIIKDEVAENEANDSSFSEDPNEPSDGSFFEHPDALIDETVDNGIFDDTDAPVDEATDGSFYENPDTLIDEAVDNELYDNTDTQQDEASNSGGSLYENPDAQPGETTETSFCEDRDALIEEAVNKINNAVNNGLYENTNAHSDEASIGGGTFYDNPDAEQDEPSKNGGSFCDDPDRQIDRCREIVTEAKRQIEQEGPSSDGQLLTTSEHTYFHASFFNHPDALVDETEDSGLFEGSAEEGSVTTFKNYATETEEEASTPKNDNNSFDENSESSFSTDNETNEEKLGPNLSPNSSFGDFSKGDFFGNASFQSNNSGKLSRESSSVKTGKSSPAPSSGSEADVDDAVSEGYSLGDRSDFSGERSFVDEQESQSERSEYSGEGSVVDDRSYVSGQGSQGEQSQYSDEGSFVDDRSYVSGQGSQGEQSQYSDEGSFVDDRSYVSGQGSQGEQSQYSDEGSFVDDRSYVSGQGSQGEQSQYSDEGSFVDDRSYVSGQQSQYSGEGSFVDDRSYVSGQESQGEESYISGERSYISRNSRGSYCSIRSSRSRDARRGGLPAGSTSGSRGGESLKDENGSEGEQSFHSDDEEGSEGPALKLPKPNTYSGYSREQMMKVINSARSAAESATALSKGKKKPQHQAKSDALLDLVEDVNEAMLELERLQTEAKLQTTAENVDEAKPNKLEVDSKVTENDTKESKDDKGVLNEADIESEKVDEEKKQADDAESKEAAEQEVADSASKQPDADSNDLDFDNMVTATRLLYAFEALVGILLQLSDELELLLTFSKGKDSPAIEALDALLSYAETIGDNFAILSPILLFYQTEEIDEELDDFLYGMNLVIDLLCELSNRVGEKQQWNPRANASFATLLELLARDTLEVSCIYEDIDTPDYELSDIIQDAWEETGHVEEIKTLLVTNDLFMFRQICYEVILSSDQWCPDNNTLMDICGVDDETDDSQMKPENGDMLSPPPEAALQILEKIHGDPLHRTSTMASVLRRLLPTQAITDPAISENFARIRNTIRNPLGMPPSSLVAITSFPESMDDPESLGVAGVGKTTMAAMVADHDDVRRFFNDGIAWIYVGEAELNYNRYVQCLQDLLSQLEVEEDEEPLFPELLHSPGDSPAKRRRREEGFMIYLRETMVEFLRFRNVLVILDDVCFEPDLDWFDFAPAPLPPDEEEEEEEEGSCAVLITSRRRDMLPPADTVEVDMLSEEEAIELLMKESGELSRVLKADAPEINSVVLECACHPLTVKSVGRWLNLKHATAGVGDNTDEIHGDIVKSMEKILQSGLQEDSDMTYEILGMSLSPAINGEPTSIIKLCFASFVRVFCERKHISDFALADSTPIVPMATTVLLFESLLDLEEDRLLQEGSLFHAQQKEAATLIPEALSALGVFKVIITYADAPEDNPDQEVEDEKYLQVMHRIQQEYGEYLYEEDESLTELTKDGERRWNKAFAKAFLARNVLWDIEAPDAGQDYALEMIPSHMMRGGMLVETGKLLADESFVRGRLFALGRENGTRRHIKDCEALFGLLKEKRSKTRKKVDPKEILRAAYMTLGSLLPMDEEEYIEEEGSPEAVEVGRCHFEIGFSLAEKRCWDGAISHWGQSQDFLVSSLGMVEFVAGILYNIAVVYSEMNEYEQALASLRQCLKIRGAIHGEEHILYAQTIQKIGDIFLSMSDYQESMESYDWALDVMHVEPSHHRIDIGDILEQMGKIHYSKGEIEEALQSFQDALRSKQVDLGEDHPELSSLFHHIGNCLSNQGRTDEAIAHLEEAIRLKQLDPDGGYERDSDVLTIEGILNNITGKQQEGLSCYEKALQVLVTKVPHKKEKVASLLHLIGCVYLMSSEHKKAMKLFEESLHARRKVLGFIHLDVASTLFNMAFLHQTRNRLDKALKCLEEALKIRELRLPHSEKVAVTHEKIGNLARGIGKTKKAENAFTEALRIRKVVHGDNHVAVATVLQELGDLTDDLGEYEDAMKHYVEALEIRENLLGPDDLAVAETYYSMGFTLQNTGALDRALQCLEESLSIRRFQLGDDAKDVGDTLNMMGFLQAKRGELDDALSLLWDALRIRKLQGDNIKVSETLNNIGNVHREKQEYDLAIECYEECLRIRRAELGDENEKVADALIAMGNVQSDMDFTDDAMDSYKEALAIRTMLFGEQDESVATVLQYMGTLEFRANELDRAFQLLDEFIRIRQENGTEPDGDYVNVLFMIGNIHKLLGGEEDAKKCWTEAYGVFKELGLAETNPQIAEVMSNLVKDEDVDAGADDQNDDGKKTRKILGRLTAKVKSAARTANEAGNVVKKATGMKGQDRGSQLL